MNVVRGTAAVGAPIVSATLSARCANGSNFSTTVQTDGRGSFRGELPPGSLPCALKVSGGSLPAALELHSFVQEAGTANVTPLTDLVLALASGKAPTMWFESGNLTTAPDELGAAEKKLLTALAAAGFSVPEGSPFTSSFDATLDDPWDQLLEQLQDAIEADPELDGYDDLLARVQEGDLEDFPSAPAARPDEDAGAMQDGGEGTFDGGPEIDGGLDAGDSAHDGGADGTDGGGDTVPGTVHASLVKAYRLTFRVGGGAGCGSACAFSDNEGVTVVVGEDDSLTVADKKLTHPYHRIIAGTPHLPELIWRDGDLEYALSDNESGTFNEINVGDLGHPQNGFPRFLGQLRAESVGGNELITRFQGTHTRSHVYLGDAPAWTSVTIGADGSFTFAGGAGPDVSAAEIGEVFDRLSCCGRVDVRATIDVDGDGEVTSSDGFELFVDGEGALAALVYRTPNGEIGVRLGELAPLPTHSGADIPLDNRVVGTAGETLLDIPLADPLPRGAKSITLEGSVVNDSSVLQQRWLLRMEVDAGLAEGQTYSCIEKGGPNLRTIRLDAKTSSANTSDYSSQNGGRCAITIEHLEIGGPTSSDVVAIEARFVGELYPFKRNNPPMVVSDGVLRWVP